MAGGQGGRRSAPRIPRSAVPADEIIEVDILDGHNEEIRATEDHFKAAKTVKDHNWSRLGGYSSTTQSMQIKWWSN